MLFDYCRKFHPLSNSKKIENLLKFGNVRGKNETGYHFLDHSVEC